MSFDRPSRRSRVPDPMDSSRQWSIQSKCTAGAAQTRTGTSGIGKTVWHRRLTVVDRATTVPVRPQADVDRSPNRTSNRGKADIQEFLPRRCMSLICVIACEFLNAFIPSSAHLVSVIPRLREVRHDVPTIRCCANRSDVSSAYVRSLLRHSSSPDATDRARRPCSGSRGSPAARTAGAGRLRFLTECRSRCSS
jgi:hypothetical protein